MRKTKVIPLTHTEAVDQYFGGVHVLSKQPLPFTCKRCGQNYTEVKEVIEPIMSITHIFRHIRKMHDERIGKVTDEDD